MYAAVGFILVHSHSAGVSNAFFIYFFGVGFFAFFLRLLFERRCVFAAVGFILVHSHPAGVSNAARKDYGCGISEQQCLVSVHHHILRGTAPLNLVWVHSIGF